MYIYIYTIYIYIYIYKRACILLRLFYVIVEIQRHDTLRDLLSFHVELNIRNSLQAPLSFNADIQVRKTLACEYIYIYIYVCVYMCVYIYDITYQTKSLSFVFVYLHSLYRFIRFEVFSISHKIELKLFHDYELHYHADAEGQRV